MLAHVVAEPGSMQRDLQGRKFTSYALVSHCEDVSRKSRFVITPARKTDEPNPVVSGRLRESHEFILTHIGVVAQSKFCVPRELARLYFLALGKFV